MTDPGERATNYGETIIGRAMYEAEFNVYSTEQVWWRRCEKVGGRLVKVGKQDGKDVWREYAVPKNYIVLRKPKRVSEEQRRLAAARFAKMREGNGNP